MIGNTTAMHSHSSFTSRARRPSITRARVASAVRTFAHGVDERTACTRTRDFYRSSAAEWSRYL